MKCLPDKKSKLTYLLIGLMATGLLATALTSPSRNNPALNSVKVKFTGETLFTTEIEVRQIVEKLLSENRQTASLSALEELLQHTLPFVKKVDVFKDLHGNLFIIVQERHVIARTILPDGSQALLTAEGLLLPVRPSPHLLPVVKLQVTPHGEQTLQEIVQVVKYINADQTTRNLTAAIVRDSRGVFYILPVAGSTKIKLGTVDYVPIAISKLKKFLRFITEHRLLDNYQLVDLTYKRQIVAQK